MKEYEVIWTIKYVTRVVLEPGQVLSDAIEDIKIPEDDKTSYCCGSFDVEEVRNPDGKCVSDTRAIVGEAVQDATYTNVFDGGALVCSCTCKYDPNTMRVFDIGVPDNAIECCNVTEVTDEYVTLQNGEVLRSAYSDVIFDHE